MNILIASDSYKGSLSTKEVAKQIGIGVHKVIKDANLMYIPMADGGEGTVDAMIDCLGGHFEYCHVVGPMGDEVRAKYGVLEDGTAVIEMAEASGLTLVAEDKRNIMKATTYGTGQLIKAAMDNGYRQIYIGIGGSATNDGGIGMAQALGAHFYNSNGEEVGYGGGELQSITAIDIDHMDVRLKDTQINVMSDVTNPLCGPKGASVIYGPQKGATEQDILQLDAGLLNLANLIEKKINTDVKCLPGAGAAGGLGMGLVAFTKAKLQSGIEAMLKVANFREKLKWADLVITGEGRIDGQTVNGKVPTGIAKIAADFNVPTIAIVGSIGKDAEIVYQYHIESMESCIVAPCTVENAIEHAQENLVSATERIMRAIALGIKLSKNTTDKEDNGLS